MAGKKSEAGSSRMGSGKTNLAGSRGESPILRLRIPVELEQRIAAAAKEKGVPEHVWVRETLAANC